ncbi:copper amine oxidase N-terminal domain-containing protein [Saccharibacillus sp. CPCC 101409]|uniref:copper amine oxidase N-terminal domain-containing protein n=1 Tax=Saccharibacillus sp. CPCC 101409 TaxID=3058041 RepID=UPI002672423B|nr:copper amine oxidase N-terminal domain-containing protein [Saccharibacillus sp. CPCC 101409]MDO3410462.1 copper amine oxidase N-terminal domain-containing protein [Saccharibacillus sp. CPCC 101409]
MFKMFNAKKLVAPVLGLALIVPTVAGAAPAQAAAATTTTTTASQTAAMKASVTTPAVELRSALDHLLSEHYQLAVDAMIKAYEGSPDAAAAYQALDQNALDMQPAIESLYGKAGGEQFESIFRPHNKYTDDLVKAVKSGDTMARQTAEANIEKFVKDFSAFLGTATGGKLPQATAEKVIRLHEDQVQDAFDKYVAGDYSGAYTAYRTGLNEMFTISEALSTAIVTQMPEKFQNTKSDTPAGDLRSALNHLLSEHFALATLQMQEQYDNMESSSSALVTAEAGNTKDFKAAIASIYGAAGADQFEKIWTTNHINVQAQYVAAVKSGDQTARTAAQNQINQFTKELAAFLSTATNGGLPQAAAEEGLMLHEKQVQQVLDQYAAKNYTGSYKTEREGYALMFDVGKSLSGAIVGQFNDKFQEPAPTTPAPTTPSNPSNGSMTTVKMQVGSMNLTLNGKTTKMDTAPQVWSGTTYIPLRYLSEAIGAEVKYDNKTKAVTVMSGNDTLKFWLNKDFMEVNGKRQAVGHKVFADKNGRTVVPVRFITGLLGWDIAVDSSNWAITLTKSM